MRRVVSSLAMLIGIVLLPSAVFAQGTLTGTVKDASGAVLPGVTVEAASPVLIEKTRAVVSDGTGQYRIVDLRPGTYSVTFTLPGFNTVKRDGVEVSGSAVISISAEMKVGAVEETITVTGETPIVDVQNVTKERVLTNEVINTLPTGRLYQSLGSLVPGVSGGGANDLIGGAAGDTMTNLSAHGSSGGDMRITVNGVTIATLQAGGSMGMATPDPNSASEVTIDTAGVDASLATGGPRINFIPKDGGNTFKATAFFNGSSEGMSSNNFTDRVKAAGLTTNGGIKNNYDLNPAFGGPLQKDKIWYWITARDTVANQYVGGMFYNANANNNNAWTYVPTTDRAHNDSTFKDAQGRFTVQATPRNKIAVTWDQQTRCQCPMYISAIRDPEAANDRRSPTQRLLQADYSAPVTSRLLLEAVLLHRTERWGNMPPALEGYLSGSAPGMISVTDQGGAIANLQYRGTPTYNNNWVPNFFYRTAVQYVTGAHSVKVGFNDVPGKLQTTTVQYQPLSYRFNSSSLNGGFLPNQLTQYALNPFELKQDQYHDLGLYAQDRWTLHRLTLNYGLRYDWYKSGFPDQQAGPAVYAPTRNLSCAVDTTWCQHDNLNWKDIEPRFGLVYDLSGNGKTALRATANKYLNGQGLNGLGSSPNPTNLLTTSTTRTWTDKNGNFIPDCVITNLAANGECGAVAATTFGSSGAASTFDPNLMTGWGHRNNNWEFSAGVQRELMPRLSIDIAYFRRVFSNFQVTDNTLVTSADYTAYSVAAPTDSRLPSDVSGAVQTGFFDLNPNKLGLSQSYNTLSDNYGKQISHWDGMDFTFNARLSNGILLQGGASIGRSLTDNCDVVAHLDNPSQRFCRVVQPLGATAQYKVNGSYTIPKITVRVSGAFQSLPGPALSASWVATSAQIQPSLGRALTGATSATLALIAPNTLYGERLNQVDLRFGKLVKFGRTRTSFNVDLYNALNVDTILTTNNTFNPAIAAGAAGAWQQAQSILLPRFLKLGLQFDF